MTTSSPEVSTKHTYGYAFGSAAYDLGDAVGCRNGYGGATSSCTFNLIADLSR